MVQQGGFMVKGIGFGVLAVGLALTVAGCGGSGSSGGTSGTTSSADSMADLPATSSLVNTDAASNLSAKSVSKAATGTPPLLKELSSSNVDTYFWNGLLATIGSTAAGSITEAQRTAYWQGEGACRMAQTVGYAFQNILQGGTSLCYMQNMASLSDGVTVTSGSGTAAAALEQAAATKVLKVQIVDAFGSFGEDIFIKVYGTGTTEGSSGYATDIWFCRSSVVKGSEQIRVNNSSKTFTATSTHSEFGSFVGAITASLSVNSSGVASFDTTKDRNAQVYFGPDDGTFKFLGNVTIDSAGLITARDYNTGTFGGQSTTNKHAVYANYTGNTMDTLRFSEASFALQDTFGSNPMTITDATEYNTSKYVNVDTGTLLTTARADRFEHNIYTGTSSTFYATATAAIAALSGFSCSATPDVVVSMDFSKSGPKAVETLCENNFANMNFCDGTTVQAARDKIFQSQDLSFGSCSTSRCPYDIVDGVNTGVFACQLWADDNPGNAQGITTANATCSSSNCCATQ